MVWEILLVYVATWGIPFVTALIFGRSWVLLLPVVASSLWATAGSLGWFPVGGDFNFFYAIFPMIIGIVITGTGLLIRQLLLNAIDKRLKPRI